MYNFWTFVCSNESPPTSSCLFWNRTRWGFIQILHQCSVSWKITPLYFLAQTSNTLDKNNPILPCSHNAPSQNSEFHIHQIHKEIALPEVIKFCTSSGLSKAVLSRYTDFGDTKVKNGRKRKINVFHKNQKPPSVTLFNSFNNDVVTIFFALKCKSWVEVSPRIIRTKFQDLFDFYD